MQVIPTIPKNGLIYRSIEAPQGSIERGIDLDLWETGSS